MIDWQRVSDLRDEVGEEDFPEIVTVFLEEVDEVLTRLAAPGAQPPTPGDMHFLKGSAKTLGFAETAALCKRREAVLKERPTETTTIEPVIDAFHIERTELLAKTGARPG